MRGVLSYKIFAVYYKIINVGYFFEKTIKIESKKNALRITSQGIV